MGTPLQFGGIQIKYIHVKSPCMCQIRESYGVALIQLQRPTLCIYISITRPCISDLTFISHHCSQNVFKGFVILSPLLGNAGLFTLTFLLGEHFFQAINISLVTEVDLLPKYSWDHEVGTSPSIQERPHIQRGFVFQKLAKNNIQWISFSSHSLHFASTDEKKHELAV